MLVPGLHALAGLLAATAPTEGPPGEADAALLQWTAPRECPTRSEVLEDTSTLTGAPLPSDTRGVGAVAHVSKTPAGYRLLLRVRTPAGEDPRTLDAAACTSLAHATSLHLALALDERAVADRELPTPPTPRPPDVTREPTTSSPARAPTRSPSSPLPAPAPRTTRGTLRAEAFLGLGLVPGAAAGATVAVGLRYRRLLVEVAGSFQGARTSQVPDEPRVSTQVRLGGAGPVVCAVLGRRKLEAPLCGLAEVGAVEAGSHGVMSGQTQRGLLVLGGIRAGFAYVPIPHLAVGAAGNLLVPLLRPGFSVAGLGDVYRTPLLGGRIAIWLEARFP